METNTKIKEMVLTALMIALVYLSGSIIKVPTVGGFVHIGDCMVFLSVIVLGRKNGTIASAVGMFLVDALGGYFYWAPFTFVIKGLMAFIAGTIIEKVDSKKGFTIFKKEYIFAFAIAGVFMIVGYFLAGTILAAFLTEKIGLIQGFAYAAKDIIGNIIQVTTGIVLAIPLTTIVMTAKKKVFN